MTDARDGQAGKRNRLSASSSPYLLQHASNPVDWWEWGPEAIAEARRLDRPLFVSVGYSTCYWCHVMEREVFENEAIARLMNDRFVCVKVDREQRPDLDEVYMAATQITTGHGGWPNSVFLTPELKPFFAGTYFGPTDQHGRPGFPRVLMALDEAWREQRGEVEAQAEEITRVIRQALGERLHELEPVPLDREIARRCVQEYRDAYDPREGGFGGAPKFPQGFVYPFLCDVLADEPDDAVIEMVGHSLRKMCAGGLFDQVGGGFHRYATDARWLVPHFEKMLYDQAAMVGACVAAFEATGDDVCRWAVEDTLAFVGREMTAPSGGFYAALDAETGGTEGQFYLWTDEELRSVLGPADFELFADLYALAETPCFEGHARPEGGAVWMREPLPAAAVERGVAPAALRARLAPALAKLRARRDTRERPRLDSKIIASWNGLMIGACARAWSSFGDPTIRAMAERAAAAGVEGFLDRSAPDVAVRREAGGTISGFQEDYAMLAQGLLALGRATGESRWIEIAREILVSMRRRFWDTQRGGYFFAEPDAHLIVRGKHPTDGAIPSGNSAAAHAHLDLFELTGSADALDHADQILAAHAGLLSRSPSAITHMTHAVLRRTRLQPARQPMVVRVPRMNGEGAPKVRLELAPAAGPLEPGAPFRLAAALRVDSGWKINANPAGRGLVPTVIDVTCSFPIGEIAIDYPPADAGSAPDQPAWAGRVVIVVTIVPAAAWRPSTERSNERVQVACRHQPCTEGACLAESIVTAELMIERGATTAADETTAALRARLERS